MIHARITAPTLLVREPLRFIPVIQPHQFDRIARCGEFGHATGHPIARVCTHSMCPHLHEAPSK